MVRRTSKSTGTSVNTYTYTKNPQRNTINMSNKLVKYVIGLLICLIGIGWLARQMYHMTDTQNFNIVQSLTGDVTVRRNAGIWFKLFPTVWTYPKASIEICSTKAKENDPFIIQFNNKSTATLNCQIGYRLDGSTDEQLIALHQEVEGSDDKIWHMVYTRLNTELQKVATQFDPSDVVGGEKFPQFEQACSKAVLHNPDLLAHGIDVNSFTIDGKPDPDKETKNGLDKQRDADLARRKALAEKEQLEAETIRTQANYAKEIAEFKGKADAETAKLKTEAERQATLAKIEAQKKVDVETLAKQEMLVKAQKEKEVAAIAVAREKEVAEIAAEKERAVAEIAKKTEAERLEMIKLQAEQRIAEANAKKVAIELSGAITEVQQAQIELERQIAQYKWAALGNAIGNIKLPQMMTIGSNGVNGNSANPLDQLIQTMTLEKLESVAKPVE